MRIPHARQTNRNATLAMQSRSAPALNHAYVCLQGGVHLSCLVKTEGPGRGDTFNAFRIPHTFSVCLLQLWGDTCLGPKTRPLQPTSLVGLARAPTPNRRTQHQAYGGRNTYNA